MGKLLEAWPPFKTEAGQFEAHEGTHGQFLEKNLLMGKLAVTIVGPTYRGGGTWLQKLRDQPLTAKVCRDKLG